MTVGANIRRIRLQRGLTQAELGYLSEAMVLRAAYTTKEDLGLRDIQEKAELKVKEGKKDGLRLYKAFCC